MKIPEKTIRAYVLKNAISYNGKAQQGAVISALFNEGKVYIFNKLLINNLSPRCYPLGYAGFYILLRGLNYD